MARINVEDTVWSDPRFLKLCIELGDELRAVGAIVTAWRVAQKHWCPDRKPIPVTEFFETGLPEAIIKCKLADKTEEGIYMRGSEEHFSWWFQKKDAGKKGGVAKAKRQLAGAKHPLSGVKRGLPSSSSSSSSSISNSSNLSEGASSLREPLAQSPGQVFMGAYKKAYKEKYKTNLTTGGKEAGIVSRLVKDYPIARLCLWVQGYLQMDDDWFKKKGHDLATFEQNVGKIQTAVDTGRQRPGEQDWEEIYRERHGMEEQQSDGKRVQLANPTT